jgi:hypothetical protein
MGACGGAASSPAASRLAAAAAIPAGTGLCLARGRHMLGDESGLGCSATASPLGIDIGIAGEVLGDCFDFDTDTDTDEYTSWV